MILITGGTGFIGSLLLEKLLAEGHNVRALMRENSKVPDHLTRLPNLEWVVADLLDYFALKDAFEGVHQVYHCAAKVSYAKKDKREIMRTNVEGTTHIVNLCLENACRLLHVSSVAALGNNEKGQAITEKNKWEWSADKSNYSISKFEAEREVWRGISEGLDAVIINPSVIIGTSKSRSESNKIFELLEKGFSYYPKGSAGFVDARDVVDIMTRLMNKRDLSGEQYLINAENLDYYDLFKRYSLVANTLPPKKPLSTFSLQLGWRLIAVLKRLGLTKSDFSKEIALAVNKKSFYSNEKIKETLGYKFIPLNNSFKEIHLSLRKKHSTGE